MKMLAFVISLGVLYWTVTSFASVRLSAVEPCPGPVDINVAANHAGAVQEPSVAEVQTASLAAPAADPLICTQ